MQTPLEWSATSDARSASQIAPSIAAFVLKVIGGASGLSAQIHAPFFPPPPPLPTPDPFRRRCCLDVLKSYGANYIPQLKKEALEQGLTFVGPSLAAEVAKGEMEGFAKLVQATREALQE